MLGAKTRPVNWIFEDGKLKKRESEIGTRKDAEAKVGERNAEGSGNNSEVHGKSMMTDKLINALPKWNHFQ